RRPGIGRHGGDRRDRAADPREGLRPPPAGTRSRAEQTVPDQVGWAPPTTKSTVGAAHPTRPEAPMKLSRRTFLPAARVSLPLPLLDAHAAAPAKIPRRMVCINTPLGLHPPAFFPEKAGKDYPLSPYLDI